MQPKPVPAGSTSCCRLHREFFLHFVEFQKLAYIKLAKSELRSNINLKCRTSVCHLRKGSFWSGPVNIISTARFLETPCLALIIGEEDNSFITAYELDSWSLIFATRKDSSPTANRRSTSRPIHTPVL